ncbi:hypothetical protein AB4Z18_18595 [Leifsonia sp. 2TAF2]
MAIPDRISATFQPAGHIVWVGDEAAVNDALKATFGITLSAKLRGST